MKRGLNNGVGVFLRTFSQRHHDPYEKKDAYRNSQQPCNEIFHMRYLSWERMSSHWSNK